MQAVCRRNSDQSSVQEDHGNGLFFDEREQVQMLVESL